MSLFQQSVLKQHQKLQDKVVIEKAYKRFSKYFLNTAIQDNIRSSKEEEYQGIFLTELFVNVLDYTLKPKEHFNLVAEYKNQTNARKADGAILNNDIAVGVIELKGTNTKDLESIRKQAFDYKANQKGCVYVITSNFEKLRFYINDATEFEEFNLFELSLERFELLYLCLQKDNILNNLPFQIKQASVVEEEQITKQFYKDYSLFKRELYRDLVKRNAKRLKKSQSHIDDVDTLTEEQKAEIVRLEKNVKLTLFKKSQKLIDRFLFIFFAEDRGLLPANSTLQILDKWKADVDFGDDRPLYNLFKQYFKFLDLGRQGTSSRAEIYAYNGGLFKEDTLLDTLEIDNDLLYKYTNKLAAYDFESQVDVNILGHIFENSLNEIESVNAEIEGGDFDKQKSKRKKDGVFYTPKYITKYIVENTVGKLCDEKKAELHFKEEAFYEVKKSTHKTTKIKLLEILETYRDWLLQLTICDPACGSGAFLNQALNFLISEHTYIDELKAKVLGGGIVFSDIESTILEKNIYGVDLNEESVEIAKLSLWLRTAVPKRKLNDLSSNIKCGNSLIDSKAVAGDKAFSWEKEFPHIFEKGGFDVVIGNPPYVSTKEINENDKIYYKKKFKTAIGQFDLYGLFTEKSYTLMKSKGIFSFITSNTFIANKDFLELRKFLLEETTIYEIINLGETVFEDANLDVAILSYSKIISDENSIIKIIRTREDFDKNNVVKINQKLYYSSLNNYEFKINCSVNDFLLLGKLFKNNIELGEILNLPRGIEIGGNSHLISGDSTLKPIIFGRNISRYNIFFDDNFINFDESNKSIFKLLEIYEQPKILIQRIRNLSLNQRIVATLDEDNFLCTNTLRIGILKSNSNSNLKYLLGILNSNLVNFIFLKFFLNKDIYAYQLQKIPIREFINSSLQNEIIINVESLLFSNNVFSALTDKFQNYLKQKFQLEKLSKKLQNWHELEFGDFIKELNKAIKATNKENLKIADFEGNNAILIPTLNKKDEFEWLELFEENKKKAQESQAQINQTDKEIDAMVYELYGLTEEEIAIVEQS